MPIGSTELVKGEARQLNHHVVEGRLEGNDGGLGNRVGNFTQVKANGDLSGNLGDRVAGRFGGEGRRTADPRVNLNHVVIIANR